MDGKIRVQTSSADAGKWILFDVYDTEGHYLDSFYVPSFMKDPSNKAANMVVAISDGFAYFREKTADELLVIKKCRLVG